MYHMEINLNTPSMKPIGHHALQKHHMNYLELISCLKIKDLRL